MKSFLLRMLGVGFIIMSETSVAATGSNLLLETSQGQIEIKLLPDIAPNHVDRDADMVEHLLGAEIVHQLEAELDLSKPIIDSPHTIMPTELGLQSGPSA